MSDTESTTSGQSEQSIPLPPPTFEFLTLSLRMQAEVHLGLMHFGEEGDERDKPRANLDAARHAIDLMGMLQEKTKGNLTIEEQRLLENSLTELRFRYVQVVEESKQEKKNDKEDKKE